MRWFGRFLLLVALVVGAGYGALTLFGDDEATDAGGDPSPTPTATVDLSAFEEPLPDPESDPPCCGTALIVTVNEGCLNVRAQPTTGAPVRYCAQQESIVYGDPESVRQADGFAWIRVMVTAGDPYFFGWVAEEFVRDCDVGASACTFTNGIQLELLRAEIDNRLTDEAGVGITDLECEEEATRRLVGDTFDCTATLDDGAPVAVEVLVLRAAPHFAWRVVA